MRSKSMSRSRRGKWRFFIGLSVLGLLIVASAGARASQSSARAGAVIGSGTTLVR